MVGTKWRDLSFEETLAAAKAEGKPVFVDCYTKTCGPCKYMKDKIFPLPEIGEYMNKEFVCIAKDMEEDDGRVIAEKYGVQVYPTFLVLDADGKEVFRMMMVLSPKTEFLPMLKLHRKVVEERERYQQGERNEFFLREYFRDLKTLDQQKYQAALGDYLYREKRDSLCEERYWNIFRTEIHNMALPVSRYVLEHKRQLTAKFGKENVNGKFFQEYAEMFQMARMLGLDYDLYVPDVKSLEKDGVPAAKPLVWRMQIYQLWNSGKGGKGNITVYLKRLKKVLPEFDLQVKMDIANDFSTLSEVATEAERKEMMKILRGLESSVKEERHLNRLKELQRYLNR